MVVSLAGRQNVKMVPFDPRGAFPEKLGGGVRPASQTLTLFRTKMCDISYPIYDLTKSFDTLFMT